MALDSDEEPNEHNEEIDHGTNQSPSLKPVNAYQKLKRDLTEEEITPGALKLMLNDIDRLNDEKLKLEQFRTDFHRADKEKAILEEKVKTKLSKEILYSLTITLGATLIGMTPSIWDLSTKYGIIVLAMGVVLLFGGFISKFR